MVLSQELGFIAKSTNTDKVKMLPHPGRQRRESNPPDFQEIRSLLLSTIAAKVFFLIILCHMLELPANFCRVFG